MNIKPSINEVLGIKPYIDRLELLTADTLPLIHQDKIENLASGKVRYRIEGNYKINGRYETKVIISQPPLELLILLNVLFGGWDYVVSYIELAVDLIYESKTDALLAHRYLHIHAHQKHNKKCIPALFVKNGTYFKRRKENPCNLVAYADLPSKTNQKPCLHIELRLYGSEKIKQLFGTSTDFSFINDKHIFDSVVNSFYFLELKSTYQLGKLYFKRQHIYVKNSAFYRHRHTTKYAYQRAGNFILRGMADNSPSKLGLGQPMTYPRDIYAHYPELRGAFNVSKLSDYIQL